MPVLMKIREDFEKRKPLRGTRIAACLHVTVALAEEGVEIYAWRGNMKRGGSFLKACMEARKKPQQVLRGSGRWKEAGR